MEEFDVCVIGSGAAGGFAAAELVKAGARVVLLEGGKRAQLEDLHIHDWPYELPRRGFGLNRQASLYPDAVTRDIGFTGDRVGVDRIRTLGGRTVHWNAATFRFSPDDFLEGKAHGLEENWPLSYQELAPYYSLAEREMNVIGTRENLPQLPDGDFADVPPALRCSEVYARQKLLKHDIRVIPTRKAVLRKSQGARGGCHYCGHCMDVCDARAVWSSDVTLIPRALATGRLSLITNALAREIQVDRKGRANGVTYINTESGKELQLKTRIVVLGCSTIESARLLLNSKSSRFPNGLSNNGDQVGRYLGGHIAAGATGYIRDLVGQNTWAGDGMTDHAYIPRYLKPQKDFAGGFGVQLNYISWRTPHHAPSLPGFGSAFKRRIRDLQPAMFQAGAFGKVLHRPDNRVTVSSDRKDAFGIPIPVVNFTWGENDRKIFAAMKKGVLEVFEALGMDHSMTGSLVIGGFASHEVGTVRMGRNPQTSVLNSFNQSWEVPNLFVVDGSSFTTMPEKNPTLTIAALAIRASQYISRQRKLGRL